MTHSTRILTYDDKYTRRTVVMHKQLEKDILTAMREDNVPTSFDTELARLVRIGLETLRKKENGGN